MYYFYTNWNYNGQLHNLQQQNHPEKPDHRKHALFSHNFGNPADLPRPDWSGRV